MGSGRGSSKRIANKSIIIKSAPVHGNTRDAKKKLEENINSSDDVQYELISSRNSNKQTQAKDSSKRKPTIDPSSRNYILGKKAQNGDEKALEELVNNNIPWAIKTAKNSIGVGGLETEDLMQEAKLGLILAAKKFDPDKAKFTTHATWWINQAIRRAQEQQGSTNKYGSQVPAYMYAIVGHVKAAKRKLEKEEKEITFENIYKNIPPDKDGKEDQHRERVKRAIDLSNINLVSMDKEIKSDDGASQTFGALQQSDVRTEDEVQKRAQIRKLTDAIKSLTEEQQFVIMHSSGIFGAEKLTRQEIAKRRNIKETKVVSIQKEAKDKIRLAMTR